MGDMVYRVFLEAHVLMRLLQQFVELIFQVLQLVSGRFEFNHLQVILCRFIFIDAGGELIDGLCNDIGQVQRDQQHHDDHGQEYDDKNPAEEGVVIVALRIVGFTDGIVGLAFGLVIHTYDIIPAFFGLYPSHGRGELAEQGMGLKDFEAVDTFEDLRFIAVVDKQLFIVEIPDVLLIQQHGELLGLLLVLFKQGDGVFYLLILLLLEGLFPEGAGYPEDCH